MKKKSSTVLLLSLVLILQLLALVAIMRGCNSYTAYKDYYNDPNDYMRIWELAGFYHGDEDVSPLFPKTINNLDIKEYMCRYDQQLPLGEGVQLLLSVTYEDPVLFESEVDRIASLTTLRNDAFNDSALDAYAIRICEDSTSEYAFVDRNNQVILYIYLHSIPIDEIEIGHELLPKDYFGYGEFREDGIIYF